MKIRLYKEAGDYLRLLLAQNKELFHEVTFTYMSNCCIVSLTEEMADQIRDMAIDKQTILGFNTEYELNEEGRLLEEIIDKLYVC
jgi:hypothetical protein